MYQESYDNSGLLVGNPDQSVNIVLIALDVTMEVLEEAIQNQCQMIVAHHPLIFKGIKKLTGAHWVERVVMKAIKHDIAIYAIHTNLDNVHTGVNHRIAMQLAIKNPKILAPKSGVLSKLTTFIPTDHCDAVRDALHRAGAGNIGEYSHCSFTLEGKGRFLPSEHAAPAVGQKGKLEEVAEQRLEVLVPRDRIPAILKALRAAHPYEEVAYYLNSLDNPHQELGSGMHGMLPEALEPKAFISYLKERMNVVVVRHTALPDKKIQHIAFCGGSGSFLLNKARSVGADAFITGDFKYHDFFEGEGQILIADIGHYESEVYTKDLIMEFLHRKFANIAFRLSKVNTNPINYS
jgi:dinuclear metal center YbgI/SA1388 family protein